MNSRYPVAICSICVLAIVFIICGCATTRSPLINAAINGDVISIKSLCKAGCNVNERDTSGQTPLMQAIWANKMDAAKLLIASGADVRFKDVHGYDALLYAVDYGDIEIINLLLDKGADIESRDSSGRTPLMHTVDVSESLNKARLLIKRGANLNAKDLESKTPFFLAIENGNLNLATEFKKSAALVAKEGPHAKIFFIRESTPSNSNIETYIFTGDDFITLTNGSSGFMDVSPGKCAIGVKGLGDYGTTFGVKRSFLDGDYGISFDAKAGQTYYFAISPRVGYGDARPEEVMTQKLWKSRVMKENTGPFEINPLEESAAKEKIRTLK